MFLIYFWYFILYDFYSSLLSRFQPDTLASPLGNLSLDIEDESHPMLMKMNNISGVRAERKNEV